MALETIHHDGLTLPVFPEVLRFNTREKEECDRMIAGVNGDYFDRFVEIDLQDDTLRHFESLKALIDITDRHLQVVAASSNGLLRIVSHRWGVTPRLERDDFYPENGVGILPDGYVLAARVPKITPTSLELSDDLAQKLFDIFHHYRTNSAPMLHDAMRPAQCLAVGDRAELVDFEPRWSA